MYEKSTRSNNFNYLAMLRGISTAFYQNVHLKRPKKFAFLKQTVFGFPHAKTMIFQTIVP